VNCGILLLLKGYEQFEAIAKEKIAQPNRMNKKENETESNRAYCLKRKNRMRLRRKINATIGIRIFVGTPNFLSIIKPIIKNKNTIGNIFRFT